MKSNLVKKCLTVLLSLACVLLLAGCGGNYKKFAIEGAAQLTVTSGSTGETVTITDPAIIEQVTGSVNGADFYRGSLSILHDGWSYRLRWYDADGGKLEDITVLNSRGIDYQNHFWTAGDGEINAALLDSLLGQ